MKLLNKLKNKLDRKTVYCKLASEHAYNVLILNILYVKINKIYK